MLASPAIHTIDLLPAFRSAAALWDRADIDESHDDAALCAAHEVQLAAMEIACSVQSSGAEDLAAKREIAQHVAIIMPGSLDVKGRSWVVRLAGAIERDAAHIAATENFVETPPMAALAL